MSQRYIGGLIYNPPGGFSGYFDGSGDYLNLGGQTEFAFGTGNFTIELWYFSSNSGVQQIIYDSRPSGTNGAYVVLYKQSSNVLSLYANNAAQITGTTPLAANTWYHVALCRSGTSTRIFLNGVQEGSTYSDSTNYLNGAGRPIIGADGASAGSTPVNGYISNLRVLKGTALYTSTFTPPVGPLQAITNTSLLTCAYPTFRDGSSNNFTITVNGNTAVSVQNPFPLTALPNPNLGNQGNGVYTMSQYQALRSQNLWPAIDPYWEYVTLMLHGNGTNGAQNNTFLDSSTNNFTITRNGNTTQGAFSPYGDNWSNYFDGTGDYLSVPDNAAFDLAAGDWTFEAWFNLDALPANGVANTFASQWRSSSSISLGWFFYLFNSSGTYQLYLTYSTTGSNQTNLSVNLPSAPSVNAWNHVAFVRSGTNFLVFLNGVQVGTTQTLNATIFNSTTDVWIGAQNAGGSPASLFKGYLSNLRLVKGTAVYTSVFTPPTAPLTAITNTSLLTCQSNRFRDNSTNNFTITRNGDVSVQRFSPFHPTAPYAAGTIGGSGYFDGSGDYLTVPQNTAFAFGTGDFTVEFWVNVSTYRTSPGGFYDCFLALGNFVDSPYFRITPSGTAEVGLVANSLSGTTVFQRNTWYHYAVTRSGTTARLFINGVLESTVTNSSNLANGTAVYIGTSQWNVANETMTGLLSNLRIVKGTAIYTANFTPPTTPVTAVTNTSLLLNFTNGGIIDNAMMNDLETVGNAQISTSVSRFGGGSLAFDGSGDILSSPGSQNYVFNGDFTVEGWVYIDSTMASSRPDNLKTFIFVGWNTGNTPQLYVYGTTSTAGIGLGYYDGTTAWEVAATVPKDQWAHIAYARIGSALYGFVNGVRYTINASISATIGSANTFVVGGNPNQVSAYYSYLKGNIDDLRITRGFARYTANFTPQRSQWQDQ